MGQRIEALGGMKDNHRAHAPAQPVAQHQRSGDHRNIVAQLVLKMNHDAAP
jgi:hypothetical protein